MAKKLVKLITTLLKSALTVVAITGYKLQIATKSLQNETSKWQYLANSSLVVFRITLGCLD